MRVKKQKQRKILAKKICKQIFNKSGIKPRIDCVGDGYFLFPFGGMDINLHFKFDKIPGMRFGIWTENGQIKHIFAEHEMFIDKFKWTQTEFHWENDMDAFVNKIKLWAKSDTSYLMALIDAYDYTSDDKKWYHDKYRFLRTHNDIEPEDYKRLDNEFHTYMNNLIKEKKLISYMYTKSSFFMDMYDVVCYGGDMDADTLWEDLNKMQCTLISPKLEDIIKKSKYGGMKKWYAVGEITDLLCIKRAPNIEIINN